MPEQDPRKFSPAEPSGSPEQRHVFVPLNPDDPAPQNTTATLPSGGFSTPGPYPPHPPVHWNIPIDLRVPWNWADLIVFFLFYIGSTLVLGVVAIVAGSALFNISIAHLQKNDALSIPLLMIAQVVASFIALAYLWVLTRVRHAGGFWQALGWRHLHGNRSRAAIVVSYLCAGVGLALAINIISNFVGQPGPVPFEEYFQSRQTVLMLMAFGILVAPLVEETMFRGFLYPVAARTFGVGAGILVTGCVFGAFHAPQLWGAWSQVALLVFVGVVLTWARARSRTVLAGYLIHVAYNSTLFSGLIVATHGLRDFSHLH
jgi:uncharacterized protein